MSFTFIIGGCRSGKSAYAQDVAETTLLSGHALFVATAYVYDEEMGLRVEQHKKARGPLWKSYEMRRGEALLLKNALPAAATDAAVVLLDCLTLWTSAYMEQSGLDLSLETFTTECAALLDTLHALPCPVLLVSNEVGLGLVPETKEGRFFRDLTGLANQMAAAKADTAVYMVSGLPLLLKGKSLPKRSDFLPA